MNIEQSKFPRSQANKPFVIFIDGADGCGKSTLAIELHRELSSLASARMNYGGDRFNVRTFDIMRSTDAGGFIRSAMINEELDETLRYNGFMYGVFYGLKKLFEQYNRNDIVICDRSQATTFAYNICAPDLPAAIKNAQITLFDDLNRQFFAQHGRHYANVHLQLDPKIAFQRMIVSREDLDVIERRGVAFQEQVDRGYVSYFNKHNTTLLRFDTAAFDAHTIAQKIIDTLKHNNVV